MKPMQQLEVFGFCRVCWKRLCFCLEGMKDETTKKTVRELREELNTIHYQWGCSNADVRIATITNMKTGVVRKVINTSGA